MSTDWQIEREQLSDHAGQRLLFLQKDEPLSYARFIELLIDNGQFCHYFSRCLAAVEYPAYFWETPPVHAGSVTRPFECVLLDAPALYAVTADHRAFAEHFMGACENALAVSFGNLGNDAVLVTPCPAGYAAHCAHLASFLRHASDVGKQAFWRAVGLAFRQRLGARPIWLSTCGTGVYWLHARLDSRPKYYGYAPYASWSG